MYNSTTKLNQTNFRSNLFKWFQLFNSNVNVKVKFHFSAQVNPNGPKSISWKMFIVILFGAHLLHHNISNHMIFQIGFGSRWSYIILNLCDSNSFEAKSIGCQMLAGKLYDYWCCDVNLHNSGENTNVLAESLETRINWKYLEGKLAPWTWEFAIISNNMFILANSNTRNPS